MNEIYTCICDEQVWIISDGSIACDSCGKEYSLIVLPNRGLESPTEFNERVKKEGK